MKAVPMSAMGAAKDRIDGKMCKKFWLGNFGEWGNWGGAAQAPFLDHSLKGAACDRAPKPVWEAPEGGSARGGEGSKGPQHMCLKLMPMKLLRPD